jgi:hypothetical protein
MSCPNGRRVPIRQRTAAGKRAIVCPPSLHHRAQHPGAGGLTPERRALPLDPSHVAGDKLCCVHEAESADAVRCHAREGGFAANRRTEVATTIGSDAAKD